MPEYDAIAFKLWMDRLNWKFQLVFKENSFKIIFYKFNCIQFIYLKRMRAKWMPTKNWAKENNGEWFRTKDYRKIKMLSFWSTLISWCRLLRNWSGFPMNECGFYFLFRMNKTPMNSQLHENSNTCSWIGQ